VFSSIKKTETHRWRWLTLAAILGFYLAVPNARPDFTRFNAHDSEYYLALSHSLVHGRGYTRSLIEGMYVPHTTWPPGLPVLLMPAMAIGGDRVNWLAVKWTIGSVGILGIALTWFVVRRLSGHVAAADLAALAVGLNPYYWDFSHQAMAEVPLTVWVLGSLLLIDRVWSKRPVKLWQAAAIGITTGLGMLLKGHVIGLAVVPLAYYGGARASRSSRCHQLLAWALFLICFSLPMLAWLARNQTVQAEGLDGLNQVKIIIAQEPGRSDSSLRSIGRAVNIIVENLRYYFVYQVPQQILPGLWPDQAVNWQGSGVLAIFLTGALLWFALAQPLTSLPLVAAIAPITVLNLIVDHGGAPRYWLVVTMILTMLMAIRLGTIMGRDNARTCSAMFGLTVLVLMANLGAYVFWHERNPYNRAGAYAQFVQLAEMTARTSLKPVGILVPGNPHAFQLMTGYPAPMKTASARFSHMLSREDTRGPLPPAGSQKILAVFPWAMFQLPRIMTYAELLPDDNIQKPLAANRRAH
jgi:hypothetical protein